MPQPQGITARERKERKDVSYFSRVLCVLSRPILCQENKDIRHCSTDESATKDRKGRKDTIFHFSLQPSLPRRNPMKAGAFSLRFPPLFKL
jgi:hypothetical protein